MSVLSRLGIAASQLDLEVKKFLRGLLATSTIAAAGSDQTDATAITTGRVMVTAADGAKGAILPVAEIDMAVEVVNTVSNQDLLVYPNTSAQINALTVTTGAFTVVAGASRTFFCDAALHWYTGSANLTGVSTTASTAELNVLDGAVAANATTGKAAILGTNGAITFGGAVTAVGSFIIGSADLSEADLEQLDGITAGQSAPSKALVTDAGESLLWTTTDATASETVTLDVEDTRTGAGAVGWAIKGGLNTNIALGSYANGMYGILNYTGSGGGVTGLGAGIASEIVMSAGTGAGTYAALELELGMPTGALANNSGTSFLYAQVYGADIATFDTYGYLLNLVGVTAGTSKMFMNVGTATALADFVKGLRIKVAGTDYVIPLITAAEFASLS